MKKFVVMSGGFHPFHAGHASLYQQAKEAFPDATVLVCATNVQSDRPFPFSLKKKLAQLSGVPPKDFIEVSRQFTIQDPALAQRIGNPDDAIVIYVRSEKDRNEAPQPWKLGPDGKPPVGKKGPKKGLPLSNYLLEYPGEGKPLEPVSKHAYMAYLKTVEFGPGITSASEIRNAWPKLNEKRKLAMVMSLYPTTKSNLKLAQNVVGMFDQVMGEQQGISEDSDNKCPPATQDIELNLKNRQKAINEYGYGPLNPDMPNAKFWMKKVDEWNLDSADEAKQSLCGNCAAFDIRESTLDCIAQGIDSESPEDAVGVIDAGDLGYCKFLKFKCASRRTCDAWVTGGPLTDKQGVAEVKRKKKKKSSKSLRGYFFPGYAYYGGSESGEGGGDGGGGGESISHNMAEGPYVQRIMHPKNVSIYLKIGKGSRLVATDISYDILDKYIQKVIQKYPQFKPTDFSFRDSDKVDEGINSDDPWGDQGNFAGDKPVNIGGDTVKQLQVGDIVTYFGQKARIEAMSKTGNTSRITIANKMGGTTQDVLTRDLKRTGMSEEIGGVGGGFGTNYPGTYEQENGPFTHKGGLKLTSLTTESVDYLDEK